MKNKKGKALPPAPPAALALSKSQLGLLGSAVEDEKRQRLLELAREALWQEANARKESTRSAYLKEWTRFVDWCTEHDRVALPASVDTLRMYLAWQFKRGCKYSRMNWVLAAISVVHQESGHESATGAREIRRQLAGMRNEYQAKGPLQKHDQALGPREVEQIVEALEDSLRDIRDKALIVLGFTAGLTTSQLANLQVEDLQFSDEGLALIVPGATDKDGNPVVVGVPYAEKNPQLCAANYLQDWLMESGIKEGYVFRGILKNGQPREQEKPLNVSTLYRTLEQCVQRAGLPGKYNLRSLRLGMGAAALNEGVDDMHVMEHLRLRSKLRFERYKKSTAHWKKNPLKTWL